MERHTTHSLQKHLGCAAAADVHKDVPCLQVLPGEVGGDRGRTFGVRQHLQQRADGVGSML